MESDFSPPGFMAQAKGLLAASLSSLQNRGELFLLELEEEKNHIIELLIWVMAVGALGMMFLLVFTLLIIWLFSPELRIFAAAGFCVLYLAGGVVALLNLKAVLKSASTPFSGSINEMKKDREWFESSQ